MLEQKVMDLYQKIHFKSILSRKLIAMLKVIVIDKQTDIDDIAKKANISAPTVKKYINSEELLLTMLTKQEYEEFKPYRDIINNKKKRKEDQENYEMCKNIIKDILETRFSFDEICRRNYITDTIFKKILKEETFLKENFGNDIITKIKFRIKETSIIRMSVPRDKKVVEDSIQLAVLNDKIHYLDNYQYRTLLASSNYLMNEGNIKFISDKYDMPEQMVYNYLCDPKQKDLLKEECYEKLQTCLKYETILRESDLNARRDLIKNCLIALQQADYEVKKACDELEIPQRLFEKILTQDLVAVVISQDEAKKLKELFKKDKKQEVRKK